MPLGGGAGKGSEGKKEDGWFGKHDERDDKGDGRKKAPGLRMEDWDKNERVPALGRT